ncbi:MULTISPECIES: PRC-barrel domain-containing protein [Catenuloplanes]|uniref:Sporulation protein YlmC with PRC-barrel domain n=1 Tax=Catenuloplanes niger TaxID=587534 RepID=A0AAE3ZYE5_9ACTN|nr:PRC-barrel domain-containing protein [Catenuloplanes niger]MDR7327519.1 sporulation protein YlmC with PRC-barrel domain [Catenuloplanes niger]
MLADPGDDIRGREVRDRDGEEIGTVDELLIDADEHKVRLLRVKHGGILGIGATAVFIPVDAVTGVTDATVHVGPSRERVTAAPEYDPELTDEPAHYEPLYDYYGYPPYWGPGYIYRGFPPYRM